MSTVDNRQDVLDSRDIIERIAELQDVVDALREEFDSIEANAGVDFDAWVRNQVGFSAEDAEELTTLKALAAEGEGSPDWEHGEALIRESYFQDYAQELAEDCGMVPAGLNWPLSCIDWEQAARELKADYFEVDFGGVTYLIRA